jgi:hypothetical protein
MTKPISSTKTDEIETEYHLDAALEDTFWIHGPRSCEPGFRGFCLYRSRKICHGDYPHAVILFEDAEQVISRVEAGEDPRTVVEGLNIDLLCSRSHIGRLLRRLGDIAVSVVSF